MEYTLAAGIVCQCVAAIGSKKREEEAEDYELNFDVQGMRGAPACELAALLICARHRQRVSHDILYGALKIHQLPC